MADKKPTTPEPVASCADLGTLYALAADPRAGIAYFGGSEGAVRSWQLNGDAKVSEPAWTGRDVYLSSIVLLTDDPLNPVAITGHYDGSLTWHNVRDGRLLRTVENAHAGWIRDLALVGDGARLASVANDMSVKVWNARTGALLHTFEGHAAETPQGYVSALYTVASSPDGQFLASADRVGEVRIWDLERNALAYSWRSPEFYTHDGDKRDRSIGGIRRVRFSPDGNTLAIAGIGQVTNTDGFVGPARVELWDWRTSKRKAVLSDSHNAVMNDVLFADDGHSVIAAGGGDAGGAMLLWQVDQEKPASQEKAMVKIKLKGHVHRLAWMNADRFVASGFAGVQLWDRAALVMPENEPEKVPAKG